MSRILLFDKPPRHVTFISNPISIGNEVVVVFLSDIMPVSNLCFLESHIQVIILDSFSDK